jgi:hypothetical protein
LIQWEILFNSLSPTLPHCGSEGGRIIFLKNILKSRGHPSLEASYGVTNEIPLWLGMTNEENDFHNSIIK